MPDIQPSLFANLSTPPLFEKEVRPNARTAKRQFDALRMRLESAQADLEEVAYNLEVVNMHQKASSQGRIDADWWDGAMRFGIWHFEVGTNYRMGSYPIKVNRWLRHLNFDLHAQRRDIQAAIHDLAPKVAQMAALIGNDPKAHE